MGWEDAVPSPGLKRGVGGVRKLGMSRQHRSRWGAGIVPKVFGMDPEARISLLYLGSLCFTLCVFSCLI